MQTIQNQIPQELSERMTKQSLERLANHLHLATQNEMGDIPLWLLWDLAITCKELNLEENYQKVLVEIQMNLEAKQRAEIERSEVIKSTSNKLYKFNDGKIPSKLNKEEIKEFKDYTKDLRKQSLLSYTKDENVAENILNLQNDLKYYTKKSEILTPNAKKDLEEKIKTSFSKLNNFENANIIP
ncbi:TPA: hypothetical protein RTH03_001490 [Campylobacter jejuni]|nr:hypothetical protein [Campylobacter jejuni]HDZ5087289.1 hypothetical protein [Campylobacter jejuni]HDZ5092410.1 hypothetical protein [Campylobacter jejuni]HDZ5100504.1 hypothetical protein [Campylobacter jejuni]HDZ5107111.1 hypothetical protein [Campylobacter jejuni]